MDLQLSQQNKSKSLNDLQAEWYNKLKESGFKEIEDTNSPNEFLLAWHSNHFCRKFSKESGFIDQTASLEYYQCCGQYLLDFEFESEQEKEIWSFHCEGKSIRQIARLLRMKNTSVFDIIKKHKRNCFGYISE